VRSGAVDMIVVDSVAALVPKAEIEGEMGDSHVGLQARLMSQALRKLTGNVHRSNVTLFFINQIRMKIGVMFGSPETTTGGNALKFYSSMRLDIRRVGAIKVGEQSVGNRTRVKVVKNKLAPPFTETEFDVLYGEGISKSGDLLDLAVADNILEKSGAWFSYGGERVGQGRENARNYLQERPKMLAEIEAKVLLKHGLTRGKAADAAASGSENAKANGDSASKPTAAKADAKADAKSSDAKPEAKAADAKQSDAGKADAKPDAKHNDVKGNDKAAAARPRA
jgi:recombination protein RecA